MAILKAAAYVLESFIPGFFYVNPLSSLNQFEIVLQRQVDLRNEAKALQVPVLLRFTLGPYRVLDILTTVHAQSQFLSSVLQKISIQNVHMLNFLKCSVIRRT